MAMSILAVFLKNFWWFIPIAILAWALRLPVVKGYAGELVTRLLARFLLDRNIYRRLHNVTLPTPDGTTQIDHVFVSRFGVFVLETKNMQGWIFGAEGQAQWTQKIYRRSFTFQNPLRQNYKHVKALESALQIPPETIHSVVTFVGGATFKTRMPPNVTYASGFIPYIKSFQDPVFSDEQVEELLRGMIDARLAPTLAVHREHVRNLRKRSDPNAERRCPKCGSPLVIRAARSGAQAGRQFWACSAYPKCNVTQNIG